MTSTDMIIGALPHKSPAERARMRTNAERLADKGTPPQKTDARKLLDALASLEQAEAQTLYDRLSGMTMAKRVVEAVRKQPPTINEEKIIRALLENPHSLSSDLSKACGSESQIWQMHFGNMAKAREADLWPAERAATRDANFYCGILADVDPDENRFTMKPDVAAAFAELGLTPSRKQS